MYRRVSINVEVDTDDLVFTSETEYANFIEALGRTVLYGLKYAPHMELIRVKSFINERKEIYTRYDEGLMIAAIPNEKNGKYSYNS